MIHAERSKISERFTGVVAANESTGELNRQAKNTEDTVSPILTLVTWRTRPEYLGYEDRMQL